MVKDTEPVLKTVITNLKKVTNVSTMLDLKKKNQDFSLPPKKNKTNAANDSAPASNTTVPAASPATATAPAPATEPAATTEPAAEPSAEAAA
jgi:hypothetical protein